MPWTQYELYADISGDYMAAISWGRFRTCNICCRTQKKLEFRSLDV